MGDPLAELGLAGHWAWLILAVLLAIGEILMPGVFLIWIAIAAAITGFAAMTGLLTVAMQIGLFAILCVVATYAGKRWYVDNPVESQDPLLNDRAARLIGERVMLVEPISGGQGRVKVDDSVWTCRGTDMDAGAWVKVVAVQGTTLMVEAA